MGLDAAEAVVGVAVGPIAFQFPGQGSQSVGMGEALASSYGSAREVFEEADDTLGFALSKICWKGPDEKLTQTENAQPALLTHSIAVCRVLSDRGITPDVAAGHSLGEFSAHVAAGSVGFADAVRVVRARGEAMAAAGNGRKGKMAAIIGIEPDDVKALCAEVRNGSEVLTPANLNSPHQVVISGSTEAVHRAVLKARERGARRAVELEVSGAFHSALMEPAAEKLEAALEDVEIQAARIPVIANVDARPVQEPGAIRDRLLDQLTGMVRWVECVTTIRDSGARVFIEPGPGTVLTGLLKRIDRQLEGKAIGEPGHLEQVAVE